MAGVKFFVQTPEIDSEQSQRKTLLQIQAPANQPVLVSALAISFNGTAADDEPVLVEVVRQSDEGASGNPFEIVTPEKKRTTDPAIQTTAGGDYGAGTDPTDVGEPLILERVHPQLGWSIRFPKGEEIVIPGGGRLGIVTTCISAAYDTVVRAECEE